MDNFNIEDNSLYDNSRPELRKRTKKRLQEISNLGMEMSHNYSFYYKDIMSGLWLEYVWNKTDEDFNGYMDWLKDLINEKGKNQTKLV